MMNIDPARKLVADYKERMALDVPSDQKLADMANTGDLAISMLVPLCDEIERLRELVVNQEAVKVV